MYLGPRTRTRLVTAAVVSALVVAGCSGEAGTPEPTDGPGQNGEPAAPQVTGEPGIELPHSGAPAVENPLATDRWEVDPCAVISEEQFARAGIDIRWPSRPSLDAPAGPTCHWSFDPASDGSFRVAFVTPTPEGLSAIYRSNDNGDYAYWEVLDPIGGYPAVASDTWDDRADGQCGIAVGVRDDRIFGLDVVDNRDGADNPCGVAVEIAGLVVDTLSGGE